MIKNSSINLLTATLKLVAIKLASEKSLTGKVNNSINLASLIKSLALEWATQYVQKLINKSAFGLKVFLVSFSYVLLASSAINWWILYISFFFSNIVFFSYKLFNNWIGDENVHFLKALSISNVDKSNLFGFSFNLFFIIVSSFL